MSTQSTQSTPILEIKVDIDEMKLKEKKYIKPRSLYNLNCLGCFGFIPDNFRLIGGLIIAFFCFVLAVYAHVNSFVYITSVSPKKLRNGFIKLGFVIGYLAAVREPVKTPCAVVCYLISKISCFNCIWADEHIESLRFK